MAAAIRGDSGTEARPFWERKRLSAMTAEEWESLCDGCGRCCLIKLEDTDTGERFLTRLACRLLDVGSCRCSDYTNRHARVSDCVSFDARTIGELAWMPDSCAYRRIAEGRGLAWWHPLVSGDAATVHQAGISVRGWALPETKVDEGDYEKYIVKGYPKRGSRQ